MFVLKGNSVVLGYDFVLWQTCGHWSSLKEKFYLCKINREYPTPTEAASLNVRL